MDIKVKIILGLSALVGAVASYIVAAYVLNHIFPG